MSSFVNDLTSLVTVFESFQQWFAIEDDNVLSIFPVSLHLSKCAMIIMTLALLFTIVHRHKL